MKKPIPAEFNDENKWFKFFSVKSLIVLCVMGCNLYMLYRLFLLFGDALIGIIIGVIIGAIITGLTMLPVSSEQYLKGAGITYDIILLRRIHRRMKRILYVKGYRR